MFEKQIDFFYGDNNSEVFTLIHPGVLEKRAGMSEDLLAYVESLKAAVGKTYALVNALSAGEFFGPNRNGDYFPEESLKQYHKTFEVLGHVYRSHVNKNPNISMGKVLFSHYNNAMHRVELILELDDERAKDVLEKLREGALPACSMGCRVPWDECLSVNTPLFNSEALTTLENISIGDKVFSHTGKLQTVLATSLRELNNYYKLIPFGDYQEIKGSDNHPFYIVNKEQFLEGKTIRKSAPKNDIKFDWKVFSALKLGDYLVFKKSEKDTEFNLKNEFARILGYYVSEGYPIKEVRGGIKQNVGVSFSFNLNEEETYAKDLCENLAIFGQKYKIYKFPKKNELRVDVYSKDFAKEILYYCGEKSKTKFINPILFRAPDEFILNLLGAAINGDGSQDHNKRKGSIRYSTISEMLGRGIKRLCFEIGIPCSINKQKATGYSNSALYSLSIPASFSGILSPYSSKIKDYKISNGSRFIVTDGYILIPIKSLEFIDERLLVKNLQIDEDESYQVLEYITHNCSICGNRAKTRNEYCDHLLKHMNQILPDGRRIYAKNLSPKFFDISVVLIPAEKTAGFLKIFSNLGGAETNYAEKLAFYNANSYIKLAELDNMAEIKKQVESTESEVTISKDPKQLVNLVRHAQNKIDEDVLYKLSEFPFKETLSTMMTLQIFPTMEDFQKIASFTKDETELKEDFDLKNFNIKIAELLLPIITDVGLTKELVISRGLVKQAEEWQQPQPPAERSLVSRALFGYTPDPKIDPEKNPIIPLGILGTLYYGYAKVFNNKSSNGFRSFMLQNPWLLPVLVGGATVGSLWAQQQEFNKTAASVDKFMRNSLISFPIAYYMSGKYENDAQRGEAITGTKNMIRKHPALTALVGSLVATKAEKMLQKVANLVSNLPESKKDELYIDIINLT